MLKLFIDTNLEIQEKDLLKFKLKKNISGVLIMKVDKVNSQYLNYELKKDNNKLSPPGTEARDYIKDTAPLLFMDGAFLTYGTASGAFNKVLKQNSKSTLFDKFLFLLIPISLVHICINIYKAIKETIDEKKYKEALKQQNLNK